MILPVFKTGGRPYGRRCVRLARASARPLASIPSTCQNLIIEDAVIDPLSKTAFMSYHRLPSIDELARSEELKPLLKNFPRHLVIRVIRDCLQLLRQRIASGEVQEDTFETELSRLSQTIHDHIRDANRPSLVPVLNATGVLLHTNLGRAPLSAKALENVARVAGGYCNLEFNLATGERGKRDDHVEQLVLRVLAQHAGLPLQDFLEDYRAIVVNNCAAATFLVLNSLSDGKETIVSRGELLEIGGGFRIPDILAKSGAILREVGTTNRTRASDYAKAITEETALLLRVHPANFTMTGFVESPSSADLAALCKEHGKILFEDQGTGCLLVLEDYGISGEDTLIKGLKAGVHIVVCSGDKLLGGPQCGIVVGQSRSIESIRQNPMLRTFRVDKMVYAALDSTLQEYLDFQTPDIPISRMLQQTLGRLQARAENIRDSLSTTGATIYLQPDTSLIGGGTTPGATLETVLLIVDHPTWTAGALASALRSLDPPVVSRTYKGSVALDLRTITPESDALLINHLKTVIGNSHPIGLARSVS